MARLRILQSVGGLDFSWAPGDEVEVDEESASVWADGVRAERIDEGPPVETPEQAEKAAARSRGGGRARKPETR
ncbi:hypothetical protein ACFW96_09095 [Streptomyces gardneri]|uniref:hypothetical protein n=1 Tax=Streptomyces gardneri TaxID=66892 RepID=UPI0036AD2CAB